MDIQNIIILASASINLILILLYARSLTMQRAMTDLIEFSPTVCFVCLEPPHDQEDPDEPHPYVTSHLVYIPDELLR